MSTIHKLLTDRRTIVAVVGATDDPFKYGGKIYRNLKSKGLQVVAVNPNRETVDGDPAFATLADLPEPPDIINVVVPSDIGLEIARQAHDLGYHRIWYQPGSESRQIIEYLEANDFDYLAGPCIMVLTRPLSA